jgi:hypothetical protein
MENGEPFLLLIEDALGALTFKYKVEFKYEIRKTLLGYSFTIFQEDIPLVHREILKSENISTLQYQILRDFMTSGIERILIQKDNERSIIPKPHLKLKENGIHVTKSKW